MKMKCRKRNYFEGCYIKQEGEEGSIAFIPSYHRDEYGRKTGYLQIITENATYQVCYPQILYQNRKSTAKYGLQKFGIKIGESVFSKKGCSIKIQEEGIAIEGRLAFGPMTPIKYDIMGPFSKVPFMQCRHDVFSMFHRVNGTINCNGKRYPFKNGVGYMEGDRGDAFPQKYVWTQSSIKEKGSIMFSAATIPILRGKLSFNGCIGVLLYEGKEYRFATYLGSRIHKITSDSICIRQGKYILRIQCLDKVPGEKLSAPRRGDMKRQIKERISCKVRYQLWRKSKIILDEYCENASFEGEWEIKVTNTNS